MIDDSDIHITILRDRRSCLSRPFSFSDKVISPVISIPVQAQATIEIGPFNFRPDRFLARVVASTVMQRARSWQSWGEAFTASCAIHSPTSDDGNRVGVVWSVIEKDTQGTVAGPWVVATDSLAGLFSASMVPPDWHKTPAAGSDQQLIGEVNLSLTEGYLARLMLVGAASGGNAYANLMHQLLLAGIEESYHLGLGRYQTAIHAILGELATHHRPVLKLLLEGETEKQIATVLRRNPHTLHDHIRIIYAQ